MASSSLQLLFLGSTTRVAVNPNSSLATTLASFCASKQLDASRYTLKHSATKKLLDLSLSFRFAGLANNALLELVPRRADLADLPPRRLGIPRHRETRLHPETHPRPGILHRRGILPHQILLDHPHQTGYRLAGSPLKR